MGLGAHVARRYFCIISPINLCADDHIWSQADKTLKE